ncbi:hypothetical protein SAMN04490195_0442 [Pseudomonas moorei]|uniref:Uncharacterized protein n=1 Tax=Pseudomonas moorei TaxID=395599 RepID=A0A1H0Y6V2_9PSED|nr:hypothetical protein SAMN04490195_0442 [Pseudomonas moorei]
MVGNDNAGFLNERGAFKSIASRLAPTGISIVYLRATITARIGAGSPSMVLL